VAYTITLNSSTQTVNRDGDTAQVTMVFSSDGAGGNATFTMAFKNIRVASWGDLEWSYDFEDALLVPGTYKLKLFDFDGYLESLFFGSAYADLEKTALVTLTVNGDVKYIGTIQEDSVAYDVGERSVQFTCDPNILALNQTEIYDTDGTTPLNPFGYGETYRLITDLLDDIFQLIDPSISYAGGSLMVVQDWHFWAERYDPADYKVKENIVFTELRQLTTPLYFDPTKGLTTVGDVLRKLAVDWCCFAGLIHSQRAFFKKLFYYDATNTQTLGTVKNRIFGYKYSLIDYVEATNDVGQTIVYTQGTNSHITDRYLKRDTLPGFYYDYAGSPTKGSNIMAVPTSEPYPGTYYIFKASDTNVPGGLVDFGQLVANFWYHYRHDLQHSRVDRIIAHGIDYDFLKDFTDDGRLYQPIGMKISLANNTTEIDALYLGEA